MWRLLFHITFYCLFCCVDTHTAEFFALYSSTRHGCRQEHKQTWRRQNRLILNRRRTLTSQDKARSSYLKEGLLLVHGQGLGMKSLTRTRKLYFANYAGDRSHLFQSTTNLCDHLGNTWDANVWLSTPYGKESRRWKERTVAIQLPLRRWTQLYGREKGVLWLYIALLYWYNIICIGI